MDKIKNYKNTPIQLFDKWAKENKDKGMEKGHTLSVSFMINQIKKNKPNGEIGIDIGCGNGWAARKMKKHLKYKKIIGIDGSETMIKKAFKIDPTGTYICKNLENYETKTRYDFVHSMEVLYYLENPKEFIKKVYRKWIKSNGLFILGIDHYKENEESLSWPKECDVFMNTKTIKEWTKIVKEAGFQEVRVWQVGEKKEWAGTLVILGKKNEL